MTSRVAAKRGQPNNPAQNEMTTIHSNRLTLYLAEASSNRRRCLAPYLTAGFPDLDVTAGLIRRFDQSGCGVIEIGFPFSDSIADGPTIQESFNLALAGGLRVENILDMVRAVRGDVDAALLAMVSMSIVQRFGVDAFARRLANCGFDGWIVPDAPLEEHEELSNAANRCGLCNVLMIAPTTPEDRIAAIASAATGFVYLIAARGITGQRDAIADDLRDNVARVRACTDTPILVGFGIATPDHVREVCEIADGAIVGSAIVGRIREAHSQEPDRSAIVESVGAYVDTLAAATRPE